MSIFSWNRLKSRIPSVFDEREILFELLFFFLLLLPFVALPAIRDNSFPTKEFFKLIFVTKAYKISNPPKDSRFKGIPRGT